ncbi:hypothetical protein AVEN_215973-1 [Araneus ventricosus]|uniref:Uncharacterized protein n=1 Tax=Araneus ventricosus TaxID=182803 RepID=A0A4Y2V5V9_ARAVE|nr:hypothetical protein AVEN_215973-1 [Araneus ventricosus]
MKTADILLGRTIHQLHTGENYHFSTNHDLVLFVVGFESPYLPLGTHGSVLAQGDHPFLQTLIFKRLPPRNSSCPGKSVIPTRSLVQDLGWTVFPIQVVQQVPRVCQPQV